MIELLLPRTDLGAFVQLATTLAIGIPLVVALRRRRARELLWFVGGSMVLVLSFFALRTVH